MIEKEINALIRMQIMEIVLKLLATPYSQQVLKRADNIQKVNAMHVWFE